VPSSLWSTVSVWGYKIFDNVALPSGVNYTLEWDGRNADGKVIVQPGLLVPGTSTAMDILLTCKSAPLSENYIITTGDTPKVSEVQADPYALQFSYGQFTRIKHHLSRAANVSVTLISPSGAETTLLNNQSQTAGDQEFEWNALDSGDASGKKSVLSTEGTYTVRVTAVNPVTGSSAKAYTSLQLGL
jgi:hypothetical protein